MSFNQRKCARVQLPNPICDKDLWESVASGSRLRHSDGMDFDAAIKSVGSQIATVADTPIPFVISLAFLSVVIWRVCRWYYDGRITSLEGRLAFKADEIEKLKQSATALEAGRSATAQHPTPVIEAAEQVRKDLRPEQLALRKMTTALRSATEEQSYSRGRFSNRSVPMLKSAILTGSKVFGIAEPYPVPVNEGGATYIKFRDCSSA